MINTKERIKQIRKKEGLTQTQFGERIGVKGNTITNYETGLRTPTDAVLKSICREFNVNEDWLRTGEGEMFTKISDDDEFSLSLGKLTLEENRFVRNAVNYLANAEPEKLKIIEDFMKKCLGMDEKKE